MELTTYSSTTNLDSEVGLGAVARHHLPHVIISLCLFHHIPSDLCSTIIQWRLPGQGDGMGSDLSGFQRSLWWSRLVHHNNLREEAEKRI